MGDWSSILDEEDYKITVNNKNIYLYNDENLKQKNMRHKKVIELYKKYMLKNKDISLLNNLLGINILQNDIKNKILQENNLINIYNNVYKKRISKFIFEKKYLGRKCTSIYSKCLNLLCEYRLPNNYKNQFSQISDPYILFMKNNSIKGYMNRLYWNEKIKEYQLFGLFYYKSNLYIDNI